MAVQFRDYYETLGVSKTATEDEIRSAFRKLARKYHPDVAKDKKAAEEKFKQVQEAYEVLSDPEKRKKYDQLGANWKNGAEFTPPPGWEGFDFSEIFRGAGTAGGRPGAGGRTRGGATGGGFSDFFETLFGGMGGAGGFGRGAAEAEAELALP